MKEFHYLTGLYWIPYLAIPTVQDLETYCKYLIAFKFSSIPLSILYLFLLFPVYVSFNFQFYICPLRLRSQLGVE